MKIWVISTPIMKIPLPGYGGLEQIAWLQAKGLAERGHKVVLVCPWGSTAPPGVELHCTALGEPENTAWANGYRTRLRDADCIVDNSVAGTEHLLVRIGGRARWLSMEELFSWATTQGPAFLGTGGTVEIPVTGLEVPSADSPFSSGWRSVVAVIRHIKKENLLRVLVKGGAHLRLTPGHGLISAAGSGSLVELRADRALGVPVACAARIPASETEILVLPVERSVVDGLDPRERAKVPWPVPLTDDLLVFLGLWLGNGCYDETSVDLASGAETEPVSRRVAALFHANVRPLSYRQDVSHQINSAALKKVMQAAGFTGYSRTKRVPDWVFDLSTRQIGLFLRGYFSADGHAFRVRTARKKICANTVSRGLAEQISVLLALCGVQTRIYAGKTWEVSIPRDQFAVFLDRVGFMQRGVETRLRWMADQRPSRRGDFPFCLVREREVQLDSLDGHLRMVSLSKVQRLKGTKVAQQLQESGIVWRKVKKILPECRSEDAYVYDLSVPNSENFLVGTTYCHNSWEKWSVMSRVEGEIKAPVLCVIHAPPNTMYGTPPPLDLPCIVAISQDQAVAVHEAWGVPSRVAYHGFDLDLYKPMEGVQRNGRYLFLARMSKIKGPQIAVDVARKCRVPLDLVGDDQLTGEPDLAHRLMRLSVNGIVYHGPVARDKTVEFFSTRKALLHMNQIYREPFGMAPVEAQLCGLPVIAFDNGAMRETVKHGETGFVVKTQGEVEKLVKEDAVAQIKPERCREWASQFSMKAMVDRYEELCKEAVETGGW